jgi:hypothetical protein
MLLLLKRYYFYGRAKYYSKSLFHEIIHRDLIELLYVLIIRKDEGHFMTCLCKHRGEVHVHCKPSATRECVFSTTSSRREGPGTHCRGC